MNILSIDLDYITHRYFPLIQERKFSANTNKRWTDFFYESAISEVELRVDEKNFLFIFDIFTRAISTCENVVFGYEHDSILYSLKESKTKHNIVNIDQHHDIYYTKEQKKIVEDYNICCEGSWVWWLHCNELLDSYTWIKNTNSVDFKCGDDSDFPYDSLKKEELVEIDTDFYDFIYVSLSPQYVAPQHWYYSDILKISYKNKYQKMPILEDRKHQSEFNKQHQYKEFSI